MTSPVSDLSKIRGQALRLLSRRAHSEHEIKHKLLRHYSPEPVTSVIEELKKQNFLDDASFAEERAVMLRSRRQWGPRRIDSDLRRLGISAKIVARALDRSESAFPSRDTLERVIESWTRKNGAPASVAHIKRLFDHCSRRGFPAQLVRDLLDPFWSRLNE